MMRQIVPYLPASVVCGVFVPAELMHHHTLLRRNTKKRLDQRKNRWCNLISSIIRLKSWAGWAINYRLSSTHLPPGPLALSSIPPPLPNGPGNLLAIYTFSRNLTICNYLSIINKIDGIPISMYKTNTNGYKNHRHELLHQCT